MNQEKIGSFISALRKEKQLTQEQLGDKLGVSQKSVSRWETGKNMPDISLLKPLSLELGITVSELIEGERQPEADKTTEQSVDQIIEYTVKTRSSSAGLWNDINFITTVLIILAAKRSGNRIVVPLAAGLLAAAIFAVVQSFTRPDAIYDTGRTDASLPAFTDAEIPVLGPSDAPEELTLLFDFQCIHCRRLHRVLPELLEQASGQYRIRLCPVPLSSACNPYIPSTGIDRFLPAYTLCTRGVVCPAGCL